MATCRYSQPVPRCCSGRSVAGDAVADAVDPAELLDVDVDQLAGPLALVADDRGLGLEGGEAAEAEPAQHQARRSRPARPSWRAMAGPDRRWRRSASISAVPLGGQPRRAVVRPRGAVAQAGLALGGMPVAPLADGAWGDAEAGGHRATLWPSPSRATISIRLCGVVRAFSCTSIRGSGLGLQACNRSFPTQPRRDNLHSNDS